MKPDYFLRAVDALGRADEEVGPAPPNPGGARPGGGVVNAR